MGLSYNDDGALDLDAAVRELRGIGAYTNSALRDATLHTIQAAAALDIAASLRVLAHESALAIGDIVANAALFEETDPEPDAEGGGVGLGIRPEDAPAGSRVRMREHPNMLGTLTCDGGTDQGEPWVGVTWDDAEGGTRAWAANVEVIDYPIATTLADLRASEVPLAGVATEEESPALRTDADEDDDDAVGGYELDDAEGALEELEAAGLIEIVHEPTHGANTTAEPDDLDHDFDGDRHPAAVDALAALKAREKAAKAAKSKKGKKA